MGFFDFLRRKKRPAAKRDSEHVTRHCFVLCKTAAPGDLSHAGEVVAQIFGFDYSADVSERSLVSVNHEGTGVGFLMHAPAPIPNQEAEEHADRNFLWPNGRAEAAQHRSHVIVANASQESPVQSAITVSRLALVALELFDGIGVYWGNASVCNSREVFEGFCQNISEQHVPVPVWLRFQPVRASNDQIGIYTLGMHQFGLMEIEVDRCTMNLQKLFEFVADIAHYLIQSGPVVADGNTIGNTEDQRILVRHQPSMVEPSRRVYKLVLET